MDEVCYPFPPVETNNIETVTITIYVQRSFYNKKRAYKWYIEHHTDEKACKRMLLDLQEHRAARLSVFHRKSRLIYY